MEPLKSFFKRYLWLIIILGLIALGIAVYNIGGAYHTAQFNRNVNTQTNQANIAVKQAVNANNAAINAEVERRTEDAVREKVIAPKLDESRRRSNVSKQELQQAKQKLNETQKNLHNANASRADNCAELRRLFPSEKFEYCHD